MKRLAVALILLIGPTPIWAAGWYLMIPPLRNGPLMYGASIAELQRAVDAKAPLYAWWTISSFDSADACNTNLRGLLALALNDAKEANDNATRDFGLISINERSKLVRERQAREAICILGDDPRLVTIRKDWLLVGPPTFETFKKPPRFLDEIVDKDAPLKAWQVLGSDQSEWACEEKKEFFLLGFLNRLQLKDVDRNQLDLTHLDINSKQGGYLPSYKS
jgi:hypothetical protein